jgi:hypothetical protein
MASAFVYALLGPKSSAKSVTYLDKQRRDHRAFGTGDAAAAHGQFYIALQ